jgi:hypothetical protein
MENRAVEKKNWEVTQCQIVADEINRLRGTDYEAHASETEPADVILESTSGKHSLIPAQVVSIPVDFRHRDDKHSVEKIRKTLAELLSARGLQHCLVGLILSGKAEMEGIKQLLMEQLAEIIFKEAAYENRTLGYYDIYERSAELAEFVHDILISHHEIIPNVELDIPAGSALPPDGRWIEEGVLKKSAKYGGAKAVKGLMLVMGVAGFVDDEQIASFQAAYPPETLPFSEIWIVTPFHGVVCLKP